MPDWNKLKNTALGWANKFSPNRAKVPVMPNIAGEMLQKAPGPMSNVAKNIRDAATSAGKWGWETGKGFIHDTFETGISNFRPSNIRDAWLKGPSSIISELKNTTFNPQAWKDDPLGMAADTALMKGLFPYMSISYLMDDGAENDLEGPVEHYTKKFMALTDVVDPFNKYFYRWSGGKEPTQGMLGSLLGMMVFNPRYSLLPKATRKIDEWLGTGVSQQELQRRFMKRLESNASDLMKKTKGLSQDDAYAQAAQNILAYNPDYYNKLMGR